MRQAAELDQGSPESADGQTTLEGELLHASREVHRLSREAEALRQRLQLEREDREDLLAVVGHELRTPLTVIGGYVRLLLAGEVGPTNEDQRRFLSEIQKACDKLDAFVTRALDVTRTPGEAGVLEVSTAPLGPLVDEVAAALRGPLADRGLAFENAADPEHQARFDPAAIERVLLNLVGNAVRYARGSIRVSTASLLEAGRALVEVSVTDDGPGVSQADAERIFTPYVGHGPAKHGGIGLGLALCRRIVEAHGGAIRVCAAEGGGSRFCFTLPGRDA